MPIYASAKSSGGNFKPAPAGTHAAICCDVVDLGVLEVSFSGKTKKQHKINICWQIEEDRDDGKPFVVRKRYTLSLHEKSGLRKDLESWRGRPFSGDELEGFDLENLLTHAAMISVVQEAKDGKVYSNIKAVMKPPKGLSPHIPDPSYCRVCDRPKDGEQDSMNQSGPDEWAPTDDDVPF